MKFFSYQGTLKNFRFCFGSFVMMACWFSKVSPNNGPYDDRYVAPPKELNIDQCYSFSKKEVSTYKKKHRELYEDYECILKLLKDRIGKDTDTNANDISFYPLISGTGAVAVRYNAADIRTRYRDAPLFCREDTVYVWKPIYLALLPRQSDMDVVVAGLEESYDL